MTFGTEQNRHLRRTFPKCVFKTPPQHAKVYIQDRMRDVKTKDPSIETVQQYLRQHILKPMEKILDGQYTFLYQLLDQKTCQTKALFTYHKRGKDVKPMEVPLEEEGGPLLINHEGYLPKEWDRVIANREMTRREVYPLFYRALIEMYTPPMNKCLILDGAPPEPILPSEYVEGKSLSRVYFTKTFAEESPTTDAREVGSRGLDYAFETVLKTPRAKQTLNTCRKQCPPDEYTHGCAEADLSAFFYVNKHFRHRTAPPDRENCDIVINSGDGDTVLIALLHTRDRIDPVTGLFVNTVWVLMRGNKASRDAEAKRKKAAQQKGEVYVPDVIDGEDAYININVLYLEMNRHPALRQSTYPVLIAVALYILSGTDFFGDFKGDDHSLFYNMGWETFVWDTWCLKADRFRNMIMMFYSGETTFNQPELRRRVYIDEKNMIMFFYQCYAAKYGKAIRVAKGLGPGAEITPAMLEEHTGETLRTIKRKEGEDDEKWEARLLRAKRLRCPPRSILCRYARILKGNVLYWVNDYRPDGHEMFNPLELYYGLPYYGFVVDPTDPTRKRLILSPVCSERMPVPEFMIPYLGKERRPRTKKKKAAAPEKKRERPVDDGAAAAAVGAVGVSAVGVSAVGVSANDVDVGQVRLTKTGQLVSSNSSSNSNTALPQSEKPSMTQAERIQKYGGPSAKKRSKPEITFHAAKTPNQQIKMQ